MYLIVLFKTFKSSIIYYQISKSVKDKIWVLGSVKFINKNYIEEENSKVGLLRWLLGITNPSITIPSKDVSINDYNSNII